MTDGEQEDAVASLVIIARFYARTLNQNSELRCMTDPEHALKVAQLKLAFLKAVVVVEEFATT